MISLAGIEPSHKETPPRGMGRSPFFLGFGPPVPTPKKTRTHTHTSTHHISRQGWNRRCPSQVPTHVCLKMNGFALELPRLIPKPPRPSFTSVSARIKTHAGTACAQYSHGKWIVLAWKKLLGHMRGETYVFHTDWIPSGSSSMFGKRALDRLQVSPPRC